MEEQKCKKDIKQDTSSNGNTMYINLSVLGKFYTDVHGIQIGYGIIAEDLGFDLRFAIWKIWAFKENRDLRFDRMI